MVSKFLKFRHNECRVYLVKSSKFFKLVSTSYLNFAIERVKSVSLPSHTIARNITPCRGPHFARELQVEPVFGNGKMTGATQIRIQCRAVVLIMSNIWNVKPTALNP
jgi:hypothetical protein